MSLLRADSLHLEIGGRSILDRITVNVEPGAHIALLGPNGSGKTTLLRALAGIVDAGTVFHAEKSAQSLTSTQRAAHTLYVGSVLETSFPMKSEEVFQAAGLTDPAVCKHLLAELDCAQIWGKEVRTLSAGERQVLLLARAFLRNPRVLLLDETLSKLDLHHLSLALGMLKRFCAKGGAALWVSHDWNLSLKHAGTVWVLDAGHWIARGRVMELSWSEILARVFPRSRVRAESVKGSVQVTFETGP
jgi:iron complex transport system ATP-binding protein